MDQTFKILAIDGGGIRGVYPAHVLKRMTEAFGIDIYSYFDMVAGTSTGSIIAAAVACEMSPSRIIEFYETKGKNIFPQKRFWKLKLKWTLKDYESAFQSLYNKNALSDALNEIFQDRKLGQITKPLLLPATDIGNGNVFVFKSKYSPVFVRDQDITVKDAVMASCSAPTFFDPQKVGPYLLCDGGLWANNPALAAVIDAQYRMGVDQSKIKILSLGTGSPRTMYGVQNRKAWGLISGWGGPDFISFMMALQAQAIHNYLRLLLNEGQVFRINFESDFQLPLDDVDSIDDLISRADSDFTYKSAEIKAFLEIK